jgi:hypothetical protein
MLSKDEFKGTLAKILENAGDAGAISETLTDLYGHYDEVLTKVSELETSNNTLKDTNASLVKANGELFMKVGLTKEAATEPDTAAEEQKALPGIDDVMEKLLPSWK